MRLDYKKASDEELMSAYQRGDDVAYDTLYDRHKRKVQGVAYMKVGNDSVADDIRQDAFDRLTDTRHNFDSKKGTFKKWINAIIKRTIAEHYRAAEKKPLDRRYDEKGDDGVKIDIEMTRQYTDEHTQDEFEQSKSDSNSVFDREAHSESDEEDSKPKAKINWSVLDDRQKTAVELRFFKNLDDDEIGRRLSVTKDNARQIVSRAIRKLRAKGVSQ